MKNLEKEIQIVKEVIKNIVKYKNSDIDQYENFELDQKLKYCQFRLASLYECQRKFNKKFNLSSIEIKKAQKLSNTFVQFMKINEQCDDMFEKLESPVKLIKYNN